MGLGVCCAPATECCGKHVQIGKVYTVKVKTNLVSSDCCTFTLKGAGIYEMFKVFFVIVKTCYFGDKH